MQNHVNLPDSKKEDMKLFQNEGNSHDLTLGSFLRPRLTMRAPTNAEMHVRGKETPPLSPHHRANTGVHRVSAQLLVGSRISDCLGRGDDGVDDASPGAVE